MWVRGLKLGTCFATVYSKYVAPHVGAWIETRRIRDTMVNTNVAPHVGAWIETPSHESPSPLI